MCAKEGEPIPLQSWRMVSSFPARMGKLTTVQSQYFLDTFNHRRVLQNRDVQKCFRPS